MRTIAESRAEGLGVAFLRTTRERADARLMLAFAATAFLFILVPGTFVGVLNLIAISADHTPAAVSRAWVQAHGHAQIFGWLGTLIIGIGYASLPHGRTRRIFGVHEGWASLTLWASGAMLRWSVGFSPAGWRLTLPVAAVLELAGFAIFLRASVSHRPEGNGRPEAWATVVIGGTAGLTLVLVAHTWLAIRQAIWGETPAFGDEPNGHLLTLTLWGFLAPFVWGFSARWVCPIAGVERVRRGALVSAFGIAAVGIGLTASELPIAGALALFAASATAVFALRLFEGTPHAGARRDWSSFRLFARTAYGWLLVGAGLGVWGAVDSNAPGIVGASRHALTVGFLVTMVFTIGPRVLPVLVGAGRLFSPPLGTVALVVLTVGCATRVAAQILAYQGYVRGAWAWLPVSAVVELAAITMFFANMAATVLGSRR